MRDTAAIFFRADNFPGAPSCYRFLRPSSDSRPATSLAGSVAKNPRSQVSKTARIMTTVVPAPWSVMRGWDHPLSRESLGDGPAADSLTISHSRLSSW